jgi:glycosyltransferase involved in cell wall biosynthesis
VFDRLLVHTQAAKKYVSRLYTNTAPITVVPESPTVHPPDFSQEIARRRIGLDSQGTVLLFFGGLREEKGVHRLLESLRRYEGTEFTLLIAGPEESATEEDIQAIKKIKTIENSIVPSIALDIRYIYDSEQYFVASDGVLCPYLDEFGEERTSHVFQEAIRLQRPVICPSFGSFESRLNSYNIGILYSPNTAKALNRAINEFVENPEQFYSTDDMDRFCKKHSFENLCSVLLEVYKSTI